MKISVRSVLLQFTLIDALNRTQIAVQKRTHQHPSHPQVYASSSACCCGHGHRTTNPDDDGGQHTQQNRTPSSSVRVRSRGADDLLRRRRPAIDDRRGERGLVKRETDLHYYVHRLCRWWLRVLVSRARWDGVLWWRETVLRVDSSTKRKFMEEMEVGSFPDSVRHWVFLQGFYLFYEKSFFMFTVFVSGSNIYFYKITTELFQ